MKKTFLVASVAMFVGMLMVGCGGGPVTKYMKDLDPIADIGKKAVTAYGSLDVSDPEAAVEILQNQVIPTYEEYISKLEGLTGSIKDEKLKAAHLVLIESGKMQLQGFQMNMQGIMESDPEACQSGDAALIEAKRLNDEFVKAIQALTK